MTRPERGGLASGGSSGFTRMHTLPGVRIAAAWLAMMLALAAGGARGQMPAVLEAELFSLSSQERSLYLLKASVGGGEVRTRVRQCVHRTDSLEFCMPHVLRRKARAADWHACVYLRGRNLQLAFYSRPTLQRLQASCTTASMTALRSALSTLPHRHWLAGVPATRFAAAGRASPATLPARSPACESLSTLPFSRMPVCRVLEAIRQLSCILSSPCHVVHQALCHCSVGWCPALN